MSVVAVTGNLASGKSSIVSLLKKKGAVIFDADKRIHQYYKNKKSPVYKRVASEFGECIVKGGISRKKLREVVFSNEKKLKRLEKIVHPIVIRELRQWVKKSKKKKGVFVAEVPLLFEKNLQGLFDKVILSYTKRDVLIKRIRKVHKLSGYGSVKRLSLYRPVNYKRKRSDFIVSNNGNLKGLEKKINGIWKQLQGGDNNGC